jgi:hypothetical protein
LIIEFNFPERVELIDVPFKKGKRNYPLENEIISKMDTKVRIYKILINKDIEIPQLIGYNRIEYLSDIFEIQNSRELNKLKYKFKSYS